MCMADYRISRFVRTTYREFTPTGNDEIIAQASKDRVGIEIYYSPNQASLPYTTESVFVAIDQPAANILSIPLQLLNSPLRWSFDRDGDTPQREFHGFDGNNTAGSWIVIERWLPESILTAELAKLGA